jgi:membrane-bound serine protease (ClpP class)
MIHAQDYAGIDPAKNMNALNHGNHPRGRGRFGAAAIVGAMLALAGWALSVPAQQPDAPPAAEASPAPETHASDTAAPEQAAPQAATVQATAPRPFAGQAPPPYPEYVTVPHAGRGKTVYVVRIDTDSESASPMIDRHHHYLIHRKLTEAEKAGAAAFVIDLNTNGGAVDAALMINDRLLKATIPTMTFVNTRAISAGAMIALSTDVIGARPGSSIGAALPVTIAADGSRMEAADAKVIAALANQLKSTAEAKGHNPDAAVAMVDPNRPLEGYGEKGEILSLSAHDASQVGVVDILAANMTDFLKKAGYEGATIVQATLTPLEYGAGQLSRPGAASVLMALAFICLLIEFKTPGVGLPLVGAAACFGLAQFGSQMADLSGLIEPILLVAGFALLAIEIFVTPGFGVMGLSGAACVLLSMGMSLTKMPTDTMNLLTHFVGPSVYSILGAMLGTIVGLPLTLKLLPKVPYIGSLVMDDGDEDPLPAQPLLAKAAALKPGMVGQAETDCRPSGVARFGDERFDVASDGRFIEKGSAVVVREVAGSRVVVGALPSSSVAA